MEKRKPVMLNPESKALLDRIVERVKADPEACQYKGSDRTQAAIMDRILRNEAIRLGVLPFDPNVDSIW